MMPGKLHVLALDPGGSTGWALYAADVMPSVTPYVHELHNIGVVIQGQMGPEKHHLELWNLLGQMHTTNYVIVCESFEYRGDDRANISLISKEYIGVVELFCQERNSTLPDGFKVTHVPQTAATGKGFWYPRIKGKAASWDDRKLKAVGLYQPTTNGRHINDATAHLLQYLTYGPLDQTQWLYKLKDLD